MGAVAKARIGIQEIFDFADGRWSRADAQHQEGPRVEQGIAASIVLCPDADGMYPLRQRHRQRQGDLPARARVDVGRDQIRLIGLQRIVKVLHLRDVFAYPRTDAQHQEGPRVGERPVVFVVAHPDAQRVDALREVVRGEVDVKYLVQNAWRSSNQKREPVTKSGIGIKKVLPATERVAIVHGYYNGVGRCAVKTVQRAECSIARGFEWRH